MKQKCIWKQGKSCKLTGFYMRLDYCKRDICPDYQTIKKEAPEENLGGLDSWRES